MQFKYKFKVLTLIVSLLFFNAKIAFADIYNIEDRLSKLEIEEDLKYNSDYKKKIVFPSVKIGFIHEEIFNSLSKNDSTQNTKRDSRFFNRTKAIFNFGLSKEFSINSNLIIEPVNNDIRHVFGLLEYAKQDTDIKNFDRHGLIAEELNLQYKTRDLTLYFGKFNVNFGNGANRSSKLYDNTWYGIGGTDMNFAYQVREKMGVKFDFKVTPDSMSTEETEESSMILSDDANIKFFTRVSGGLFKSDNTKLFTSSISRKNPLYYNTNAGSDSIFRSYFLSTDFVTHNQYFKNIVSLGHVSQSSKDYNLKTQNSYAISAQQTFYPAHLFKFGAFGEYAAVRNFDGIAGAHQSFVTGSFFLGYEGLNIAYVYNKFKGNNNTSPATFYKSNQLAYKPFLNSAAESSELTFGYDFKAGFGFKIGRKNYSGLKYNSQNLQNISANHIMCNYAINY